MLHKRIFWLVIVVACASGRIIADQEEGAVPQAVFTLSNTSGQVINASLFDEADMIGNEDIADNATVAFNVPQAGQYALLVADSSANTTLRRMINAPGHFAVTAEMLTETDVDTASDTEND